jgi:hypothetical protein
MNEGERMELKFLNDCLNKVNEVLNVKPIPQATEAELIAWMEAANE